MTDKYKELSEKSLQNGTISDKEIEWILTGKDVELLPLLHAAYTVRYHYYKNNVKIHILNNVQSGNCTEDCKYCAQSKKSENTVDIYPIKTDDKIMEEAGIAYKSNIGNH